MTQTITIIELVVAVLLTVSILLQQRGAGLSQTFGGSFGGYYTRRGFEKFLMIFSIVLSVIFLSLAITSLILSARNV